MKETLREIHKIMSEDYYTKYHMLLLLLNNIGDSENFNLMSILHGEFHRFSQEIDDDPYLYTHFDVWKDI